MTGMADGALPLNDAQFYFTTLMICSGAFLFAFSVGAIGSIDEARMQKSEDAQLNINAMQRFLARYPELPADLIQSITDYYHYNIKQEAIGALTTSAHMLDDLPLALRCEAVQCLTRDALGKVPLFSSAEEGFMIALTQKMIMAVACPNEVLTHAGVPVQCMYVVLRGQLEVLASGGLVISSLSGGACFNEQSLASGEPPAASVVAVSYSVLYQLKIGDFKLLEKEFVKTFEGFRQAAKLAAKAMRGDVTRARNRKLGSKKHVMLHASETSVEEGGEAAGKREAVGADGGADNANGDGGATGAGRGHGADDNNRKSTMQRSALPTAAAGSKCQPILLPGSRPHALWSCLLLLALCYDAIALPAKLSFIGDSLSVGLCVLDVFADIVLFVDVWLRFRLAALIDGQLVFQRRSIRKRYLRVGFLPNLIGSVPLSPLLLAWPSADARVLQAPRVLRLARLLWRIRASAAEAQIQRQQPTNLEELLRVFRGSRFDLQFAYKNLLPLLALYGALAHYVACAYWSVVLSQLPGSGGASAWIADLPLATTSGVSTTTSGDGTTLYEELTLRLAADEEWLPTEQLLRSGSAWAWYYRSLYFSVSTLTGLGKDVIPLADDTILFTLCVFVVGVLVFAYITSSIVTVVNQADISARQFQRRKIGLLGYMHEAFGCSTMLGDRYMWTVRYVDKEIYC